MSNDKMIYDDEQSIGVDVESFQKLEAIVESILNGHNNSEDEQWLKLNKEQLDQLARILKNVKY